MAACFQTTLRNVSGGTLTLGWLYGKTLADAGEVTLDGELSGFIACRYPGIRARRVLAAVQQEIDDGLLSIVSSPSAPCSAPSESSSSSP